MGHGNMGIPFPIGSIRGSVTIVPFAHATPQIDTFSIGSFFSESLNPYP